MAKIVSLEQMLQKHSAVEVTEYLENELQINNLFMVVGRPGSGKSTFLKIIGNIGTNNYCINTDEYSKPLRPLIIKEFGNADLIDVAINCPQRMIAAIGAEWLKMAADSLAMAPKNSNVFVEVPYGMRPEFGMFRYFGAKVIYVGCENPAVCKERIKNRGNPQTMRFIETIPDKKRTLKIANDFGLNITCIDTSKTIEDLRLDAKDLLEQI